MASALYAEELTCPVCLSIFTEPLTLPCGHSFCRGCITAVPEGKCPQCRAPCPPARELQLLPTSLILKSLAQKARERPQQQQGPGTTAEEPWLCPEHDERMKLFCVTDQRLACIICRDGEAHDGHRFKPIREAAAALRRDIDLGLVSIAGQTEETQKLVQSQSAEVRKAKERSAELKSQVQREFNAMHQFLRRREDQILNEMRLKEEDAVENMSQSLSAMKRALSECGELKESWTHIMEVTDPETFLRRWSEEHSAAAGDLFKARTPGLSVVPSPEFQGPYQSHLQFFMWKEMLQEVEPKAEALTLKTDDPSVTVSEDQRSFYSAPQGGKPFNKPQLFGQSTSSPAAAPDVGYSGGLFGASAAAPDVGYSGGLFGASAAAPDVGYSGGLFGASAAAPDVGYSGGLFGASAAAPDVGYSGGLFGASAAAPNVGYSDDLFGSPAAASIFGTKLSFGSSAATFGGRPFSFTRPANSSADPPPTPRANVPPGLAVSSSSTFSSGQHYWEVELGLRDFWCVGITGHFLKHEAQKYFVCEADSSTEMFLADRLLKLGLYLNCSSRSLTFYDADSMKRLHQVHCGGLSLPVSAYFCIRQKEPDRNPLSVCRY